MSSVRIAIAGLGTVGRVLVRKLADLLGLEHHVMIDAKVAVLRDMGLSA